MSGLFLLMLVNSMTSLPATADNCNAGVCWRVSPQTCVTEQAGQNCQSALSLYWYSDSPQSLCAYLAEKPLQCWENIENGEWQQSIDWSNIILSLRNAKSETLLQTELQVLSRQPVKRRRLNGPWSIF